MSAQFQMMSHSCRKNLRSKPPDLIDHSKLAQATDHASLSPRDNQVSVRLRFREDARIGPGKVALLEAVAISGSVSQAGASLKMSARRAWLLIDSLNKAFDMPVVVTDGGKQPVQNIDEQALDQPKEAHLTDFGRALIDAYRAVEADTRTAVEQRFSMITKHLRP